MLSNVQYSLGMAETYYPAWFPRVLDALVGMVGAEVNWAPELLLVVWSLILFVMLTVAAKFAVIFMVLMERKVLAWMTQRKGPNRVGPWGILQTLADGIKLLFKEDIMNPLQDKLLFTLAPAIFFLPTFVLFALVPFTDSLVGVALPAGALFVFALSSISVIGMVLAGWASNNKYSLIGGMRSAAQAISYEIPLVLSVLAIVLYSGTMNITEIVQAQAGGWGFNLDGIGKVTLIPNWFFLTLTPVTFTIFFISAIAEVNRIPFDLPEAESELVSGYNTEYSGMKFAMFFLAEYAALFAMCAFIVAFFFGGYLSPFNFYLAELFAPESALTAAGELTGVFALFQQVEMLTWFMAKTYVFIFIAMWIRGTLPRLKPDQLMGFSWKFLIPLSLINVFVVCFERYWHIGWEFNASPTLIQFLIWVAMVVIGFGGFFYLSSKMLSDKLNARLAQR